MASCDCPEGDSLFNIKDYQKAIVYYERCKFYCGGNLNHTGKFNLYQSYKLNHNYYDAAETINELLNDLQLSNDSTFKYLLLEKFMMLYFAKDLTSLKFEITHYLNYGSNDHLFQKRLYWFLIAIHLDSLQFDSAKFYLQKFLNLSKIDPSNEIYKDANKILHKMQKINNISPLIMGFGPLAQLRLGYLGKSIISGLLYTGTLGFTIYNFYLFETFITGFTIGGNIGYLVVNGSTRHSAYLKEKKIYSLKYKLLKILIEN